MTRIPDDAPVFAISVVERMTGLTRRRIRYYEKVGLLTPARTDGNRRLYSPADVRLLAEAKRLREDGLDLQGIRALTAGARTTPGPSVSRAASDSSSGRAAPTEVRGLERYEDARARLTGRGPAGGLDRLHPGEAGRLIRPAGAAPSAATPPKPPERRG